MKTKLIALLILGAAFAAGALLSSCSSLKGITGSYDPQSGTYQITVPLPTAATK